MKNLMVSIEYPDDAKNKVEIMLKAMANTLHKEIGADCIVRVTCSEEL